MRIIKPALDETLYMYCKKNKFLSLDYTNEISWFEDIKQLLSEIPSFLTQELRGIPLNQNRFKNLNISQLKCIYSLVVETKSSYHPFFYKDIKSNNDTLWGLTLLHTIYFLLAKKFKKPLPDKIKFLNLAFSIFEVDSKFVLLGPVALQEDFADEDTKITYIKNLKQYFVIEQHAYELINLFNQRETISQLKYEEKVKQIHPTFKYTQCFNNQNARSKSELRSLAIYCIYLNKHNKKKIKDIDETSFKKFCKDIKTDDITSQIKSAKTSREFESIEWFNNLSFKHTTFEKDIDRFTTDAMNFLCTKLQADTYIFNRYYQHNDTFELQEQKDLHPKFKSCIKDTIHKINTDEAIKHRSISYLVVNGYKQDIKPINLIGDLDEYDIHQIFDNDPTINSILSIPLIFDKRVFAVIHFLGFSKHQFDEIDQKFLLKHASIISRRYIENIFDTNFSHITKLLEGLEKTINNQKSLNKRIHEICENITKIFSCDGLALWINQKEVYHTQKELDEITLEAEINFSKQNRYPFDANGKKCLFSNDQHMDIIVSSDVRKTCSLAPQGKTCNHCKGLFTQNEIISFMTSPIKSHKGVLTGTLMIFDRSHRNYDERTQNMFKRISLHLGSILNIISSIKYQTQQNDERSLHESAQYLNMIDSRAKDLERRLDNFYFPNQHDKSGIFLNIQDIKDYTSYTKHFLFMLFQQGKFTKKYDALLKKDIINVQQCKESILLKQVVIQVLNANKNKMNQSKNITYKDELKHKIKAKLPKQEFHNVINNIVNNAIKYGKSGTYIKISDELTLQYYNLSIENIGYMIHQDEQERIFQKNYRGNVTKSELLEQKEFQETTSENKGIGLYYAKEIANAWNGNIKLEQEQNQSKTNTRFSRKRFLIKIPIKIIFKE